MLYPHVGVAAVVVIGLAVGCGSAPSATSHDPSPPDIVVAASPATTQELGVVQWKLTTDPNQEAFATTGYDAQNNVRSEIDSWAKRDASGSVAERGIASTVPSTVLAPAYFHYMEKDGHGIVDRNDFETSPGRKGAAARALALAMADLEAFAAAPAPAPSDVNAASVHPLGGGPIASGPGVPLVHVDPCRDPPLVAGQITLCEKLVAADNTAADKFAQACPTKVDADYCPCDFARGKFPFECLYVETPACTEAHDAVNRADKAVKQNRCKSCTPARDVHETTLGPVDCSKSP
jgi:hypothetical protein